jgi:hypothetical protein
MTSIMHHGTRTCLALTAMTFCLFSPARALDSTQTVQGLYQFCKVGEDSPRYGLCIGYVAGVGDAMQIIGLGVEQKPELRTFAICDKPSYGTMVQAFVNWAEQNPSSSESNRIVGVMKALRANWPCRAP